MIKLSHTTYYNQLYFYLSLSVCHSKQKHKQNRQKPIFTKNTNRVLLKICSVELKIESILNLMWLTIVKFMIALFTECSNNTINI